MLLETLALALGIIHFGVPLGYYIYMKRYLSKPWNVEIDESYKAYVTVILPTYNEAGIIWKKLDNLYQQDYPKELFEVIVIDGASSDGTAEIVKKWSSEHEDISLKLIEESERKGKAHALNHALKHSKGEVIVIADADAFWPKNALLEAIKWFSDPKVGAVSCLKNPTSAGPVSIEEGYRQYYNALRVAESKVYATPIFHGELAAFRKSLLEKLNGFPVDIGADDSHTATRIALMGYRAITPENLVVEEIVPSRDYSWWRVRRAQHLIQHFVKALKIKGQKPKEFKKILAVESFLHIINPFLLLASTIALTTSIVVTHSFLALGILALGAALLYMKRYRTWIVQQFYLLTATLRNLRSREIVWSKQIK